MEELIKEFQERKDKVNNYLNYAKEVVGEINSQCALDLNLELGDRGLKLESEFLGLVLELSFRRIASAISENGNDSKKGIIEAIKRELSKSKNGR